MNYLCLRQRVCQGISLSVTFLWNTDMAKQFFCFKNECHHLMDNEYLFQHVLLYCGVMLFSIIIHSYVIYFISQFVVPCTLKTNSFYHIMILLSHCECVFVSLFCMPMNIPRADAMIRISLKQNVTCCNSHAIKVSFWLWLCQTVCTDLFIFICSNTIFHNVIIIYSSIKLLSETTV